MKEIYQLYEAKSGDWEGLNVVAACTIKDGDDIGRGVAICSPDDVPDDDKGKALARRYALRALKGRGYTRINDKRAVGVLLRTDCPFTFHVDMHPVLTWQERRQLFGYKRMFEYNGRILKFQIGGIADDQHVDGIANRIIDAVIR